MTLHAIRGMTFIELVLVLALTGILLTLAIPGYQIYIKRIHRSEVQAYMLGLENREEQYLLDARRYADLSELHDNPPASTTAYYSISIETDHSLFPPSYTIKAIPNTNLAAQGEPVLELNSNGIRKPPEIWNGLSR